MSGGLDRDEVEETWGMGRCQVRRCQPDDFELTGFAEYIGKLAADKGRHSYAGSKNLKKPKVFKSVTKLSRKKFAEIIRAGDGRAELLESLYQGRFKYLDSTTYISRDYGGFYLYSRLRRRESVWEEKRMDKREPDSAPGQSGSVPKQPDSVPDRKDFGNIVPCKAYLEYDWQGRFGAGEARCSILFEAMKGGEPQTHECFRGFSNATKNRVILKLAIAALEELKPCRLEIHSSSQYLTEGIQGRFSRQKLEGYKGVKNADLIEKFLEKAEPFDVTAVCEEKNSYTEVMRIQRELRKKDMRIERDTGYGK